MKLLKCYLFIFCFYYFLIRKVSMIFKRPFLFHLVIFLIIFLINVYALFRISMLDLFDFFAVVHDLANVSIFIFTLILSVSQLTLYSIFFRFVQNDKKTQQNRDFITNTLKDVSSQLKNLDLLIKNKVVNNISLKEKLSNVLKSVNYNDNHKDNAFFRSIFEKISIKVADTYTKFKAENKTIDYFAIVDIQKELNDILISDSDFNINSNSVIELSKELLLDFQNQKQSNKDVDTKELILDYFKVLCESAYSDYSAKKNNPKLTPINENKNNNTNIKGNDNTVLQDAKAESINININKK